MKDSMPGPVRMFKALVLVRREIVENVFYPPIASGRSLLAKLKSGKRRKPPDFHRAAFSQLY
jgi:hypothetical protein